MNTTLELVAPIVILNGAFILIGSIYWIVLRKRRHEIQAQVQTKLIEKFESARDMAEFLQTDAGNRFMKSFAAVGGSSPVRQILGAIQGGIVLTFLGVALLLLQVTTSAGRGLGIAGTLVLALGLGLLAAGAVSHRLSRSWGLLPGGGLDDDGAALGAPSR